MSSSPALPQTKSAQATAVTGGGSTLPHSGCVQTRPPTMLWRSGPDGSYMWFNKAWLDFTGKGLREHVGYRWIRHLHPDDRDRSLAAYETALRRREEFSTTYRLRRSDGQYRRILDRGCPHFAVQDQFVGFIGSALDIDADDQQALLQEVRHRVRNNMQVVNAFVKLLSRCVAEQPTADLAQVAARVQGLALMQQYFYAGADGSTHVRLGEFLQRFATDFAREAGSPLSAHVAGPDILVDVGKATSIGLTVAEVVLAAVSSAGPDRGRIDIRLAVEGSTLIVTVVGSRAGVASLPGQMPLLQHYARLIDAKLDVAGSADEISIAITSAA